MADRLISADDLIERAYRLRLDSREQIAQMIESAPTVEAEPTYEQVMEYCHKRCLTLVTDELFDEMQARWSNEPVRHGHWISKEEASERDEIWLWGSCSVCGHCDWDCTELEYFNYCPHCGAKMDGGKDVSKKETD